MNTFAEIIAVNPEKAMELCLEVADRAGHPYCYVWFDGEAPYENDLCELCGRHAFDDGSHDHRQPLRYTCDSEECRRLYAWYWAHSNVGGQRRRDIMKKLVGKRLHETPKFMRREAILAAMLVYEAQEKERERKSRLRVAA